MKWIDVRDRLPENEKIVLCCQKSYLPRVALFHKSERDYLFLDPDCMRVQFMYITHWMPLPPAPDFQRHQDEIDSYRRQLEENNK